VRELLLCLSRYRWAQENYIVIDVHFVRVQVKYNRFNKKTFDILIANNLVVEINHPHTWSKSDSIREKEQ